MDKQANKLHKEAASQGDEDLNADPGWPAFPTTLAASQLLSHVCAGSLVPSPPLSSRSSFRPPANVQDSAAPNGLARDGALSPRNIQVPGVWWGPRGRTRGPLVWPQVQERGGDEVAPREIAPVDPLKL